MGAQHSPGENQSRLDRYSPCNEPFDSAHSLTGRPSQLQACRQTVQSYLAKDIIEPVLDNSPGLYAAFFGVPKKDSQELRGCWDGRALNEYIRYEHFKMEGVQTLKDLIQPGDFMTKVDISDAYPHLLVPTHLRHLFRFIWQGTVYQYRSLCFGLSSAPRIFTKVMKPCLLYTSPSPRDMRRSRMPSSA